MDKLGRGLAERSEPFLLRELLQEPVIQFLDLAGGVLARAMEPGALDVAADHFAHFARIKRLADVVVSAEAERFLGRLERAEAGQHDDGKMWIDLANQAQAFDARHSRHPDIHDDGVGLFFGQELQTLFDRVGGMHLIARLQEHAQTFARSHFVVDDEDLREFGVGNHCSHR